MQQGMANMTIVTCASDLVLFEAFGVRLGRKEASEIGKENKNNEADEQYVTPRLL